MQRWIPMSRNDPVPPRSRWLLPVFSTLLPALLPGLFACAVQAAEQAPSLAKCLVHTSAQDVAEEKRMEQPFPSCGDALTRPGSWDFSHDPFDNIKSLRVAHQRMREEDGTWRDLYATYWLFIEFPSGKIVTTPFEAVNARFAVRALHLEPGMDLVVLTRWSATGTGYAAHEIEIWRAFEGRLKRLFDTRLAEFVTRTPPGEDFRGYYDVYIVYQREGEADRAGYKPLALEMRRVLKGVPQDLLRGFDEDFAPNLCLLPKGDGLEVVAQGCDTVLLTPGKAGEAR